MVAAKQKGFTLIESIVAIVLMAFLMIGFSSLLAPQAVLTADSLTQQRGAQLASIIFQEMYSRPFDENNNEVSERCIYSTVAGSTACSTTLGSEGNDRDDFDDYDTGNVFVSVQALGVGLTGPYLDFQVNIAVDYVDDSWATVSSATPTKHARITVRKGNNGQQVEFDAYRSNF